VLARYNLQAREVNDVIATALGGHTTGSLLEKNRRVDIVVRLAERQREDVEAIRALPVRVGESGMLALGALAEIQRVTTVSPILRDAGQRRSALLVSPGIAMSVGVRRRSEGARADQDSGNCDRFGGGSKSARKRPKYSVVPTSVADNLVLIVIVFAVCARR
jgi:cobalt-zinc-cadmium resistance protein CzcA